MLKWITEKLDGIAWIGFIWLSIGTGSINYWETVE
jgi:hypothetical protein